MTVTHCKTCDGSGEIMIQEKHRESYHRCPMCEGDTFVSPEVLAEYEGGFMSEEDAAERIIADLTGEDR